MLNRLKAFFNRLFKAKPKSPTGAISSVTGKYDPNRTKPSVQRGEKVGNVTIRSQAQLDKHTAFKPGEQYRLGEGIVTVHASKADMLAAMAKHEANRLKKHAKLTERGIQLMLMTPEQLKQLKLDEWLAARKAKASVIGSIMGAIGLTRFIKPTSLPPSGAPKERFKELVEPIKEEEKTKV